MNMTQNKGNFLLLQLVTKKRDLLGAFDPAHSVQSKRARVRLPHTTLLFQVLTFVLPSVCCYC